MDNKGAAVYAHGPTRLDDVSSHRQRVPVQVHGARTQLQVTDYFGVFLDSPARAGEQHPVIVYRPALPGSQICTIGVSLIALLPVLVGCHISVRGRTIIYCAAILFSGFCTRRLLIGIHCLVLLHR